MPNVMVALPNIGGALCSTPQSLADTTRCRAVTLPRCETHYNLQGCLKLPDRSKLKWAEVHQYYGAYGGQSCAMVPKWRFLATFLHPVFSASRVQQVSDLRLKFTVRPHHVPKYGKHPISGRGD